MAKDPRYSLVAVNAKADALCALLNSGYLRAYSGTRPDGPDEAVTQNDPTATLLAEWTFSATAFAAASAGVASANTITQNGTNLASGTLAWFRALKSDGTTGVVDGTIGTVAGSFDMSISDTALVLGGLTPVAGFTYQEPQET